MKYIILCDSDNIEPFVEPRQLAKINGEPIVARTIRLLKENGVKEIIVTSHDKRFDNLGATRYEPKFNDYRAKEKKGYWLSAFPIELLNEPVTFLLGDVYYSENAIKTIVNTQTSSTMFFCTDKRKGLDIRYIKQHDEPFAYKVIDTDLFKKHIDILKRMYDEGKTHRHPIIWELYRSINGLDVNKHILTTNYTAINDETCDIDRVSDIMDIETRLGGIKMVKCQVIEKFTLKDFDKLQNLKRSNLDEKGWLYVNDEFECDEDMARYLTGANAKNKVVVKILEVDTTEMPKLKEEPKEEIKPKKKKTTKKKTSKK